MNTPSSDSQLFLEAATRIGARLCRDAIWCGDRCNWLGDSMEFASSSWTVGHRSFGPDLYAGTSGIALFLGQLYSLTGEPVFLRTAEGALRQSWSRRETVAGPVRFSFYSGWLGMAWVRDVLGTAVGREEWLSEAGILADNLENCAISPKMLDVISGSAGAIPALLDLHRRHSRPQLLEVARAHAENLLNTARLSDAGWSWHTLDGPNRGDLTGFSHGTAGIACALLEVAKAFGDERFEHAAREALRYERRWFDPNQENWLDLRVFDSTIPVGNQPANCSLAWCHGAPGIALSRLRAWELLGEALFRSEAEAALRTTAKSLSGAAQPGYGNFSLCHGHAGNAESLLYASQLLGPEHRAAAEQVGRHLAGLAMKRGDPLPCGVPNGGETPGLMLGRAGMGYFLLRLHAPLRVPGVMILLPLLTTTSPGTQSKMRGPRASQLPARTRRPQPVVSN